MDLRGFHEFLLDASKSEEFNRGLILKQYEGNFRSSETGEIVTVASRDGKLWIQTKTNVEFEPHPVAADISKNEWFGKMAFQRNKQGSVTALTMSNGEVRKLSLEKIVVSFHPANE